MPTFTSRAASVILGCEELPPYTVGCCYHLDTVCPLKVCVVETWSQCRGVEVAEPLTGGAYWEVMGLWGFMLMNGSLSSGRRGVGTFPLEKVVMASPSFSLPSSLLHAALTLQEQES